MAIRLAIWLALGRALGLPVGEWLESIDIQLRAAKRQRGSKPAPLTRSERLRLAQLATSLGRPLRSLVTWIATPEALIRWLKRWQERRAQGDPEPPPRAGGRPRTAQTTIDAILFIYDSGLTGLKRIRGELAKNGINASPATIRRVLTDHGRPPGPPNGGAYSTWRQFLRLHARELVSIDFIQIPTGLLGKVVYQFALCAIEHDTRRVHLLGMTPHPDATWLTNVMRSATMEGMPLASRRYWIHDNDGKFTALPHLLRRLGHESVNIAPHAPDMNAYIERFFGSLRRECLDQVIAITDDQLRRTISEYIDHYNTERPHQGIGNVVIGPWEAQKPAAGELVCDTRLNGLLKSIRRAA